MSDRPAYGAHMRFAALFAPAILALSACGEDASGRGGLTEGEARELDEAAAIVDAQRIEAEDLPTELRPAAPDGPADGPNRAD